MRFDPGAFTEFRDSFVDQCADLPTDNPDVELDCRVETNRFSDPYVDLIRLVNDHILHEYPAPFDTANSSPYTVFFTSGERLSNLVNNKNGRFRLEATVAIGDQAGITNGVYNRSPRASIPPVLPVPYIGRDAGMSRFFITAFDPDGDDFEFRLGTIEEYGAVLANIVKRSQQAFSRAFTPGYYLRIVDEERSVVCSSDPCSNCTDCIQQASQVKERADLSLY